MPTDKDLSSLADSLRELTKSKADLESLTEAKNKLLKSGDISAIRTISQYEKSIRSLQDSLRERLALEKEIAATLEKGQEVTEGTWKQLDNLDKRVKTTEASVAKFKTSLVQYNEKVKELATRYTIWGKASSILTSGFAKLTAGITVAGLATKALERFTQAAQIRQDIINQSFKELDKVGPAAWWKATKATADYSEALQVARKNAILFGYSADEANGVMVKMARIAGTDSPKALSALSSGVFSVARTLNIDTNEAMELVTQRIEKFGGTAASAVSNFIDISRSVRDTNKEMGMTVLKADDIAKALLDMGRDTTVYAMDMKMIGGILRENTIRLQAQGESYENAFRKAKLFTEGVTKKAPDWAKYLAGDRIYNEMIKLNPQEFVQKFGAQLDQAKPGLSKKVSDILHDPKIGKYSKVRMIQELTKDTSVGITAMNTQILKTLGDTGEAVAVIAEQWGVGYDEAQSMLNQAKDYEATTKKLGELQKLSTPELAKKLGISETEAKYLKDNEDMLRDRLRLESESAAKAEMKANLEKDALALKAKSLELEGKLAKINEDLAKPDLTEKERKGLEDIKKNLEDKFDQQKKAIQASDEEYAKLSGKVAEEGKGFVNTLVNTGKVFSFITEHFGSLTTLGAAAVSFLFLRKLNELTSIKDLIKNILVKMTGGGGGASGAGGNAMLGKALRGYKGGGISGGLKGLTGGLAREGKLIAGGLKGMRGISGFAGAAGKLLGPAMTLASAGMGAYDTYQKIKGGAGGKEVGASAGSTVGGLAGGAIGGALGALGGPLGVMVGAGIGNWLGEKGGSWLGEKAGGLFEKGPTAASSGAAAAAATAGAGAAGAPAGDFTAYNQSTDAISLTINNASNAFGPLMAAMKRGTLST